MFIYYTCMYNYGATYMEFHSMFVIPWHPTEGCTPTDRVVGLMSRNIRNHVAFEGARRWHEDAIQRRSSGGLCDRRV